MGHNEVSVGGSVGGNVVVGRGNVVAAAPPAPPSEEPAAEGMSPRLGFVVDIVGFGKRNADERTDAQQRLDALVRHVVADLGVDVSNTASDDAGDARLMFLPVGVDSSRVLPAMIIAMTERLGRDNRRYRDRMRLRMSIGTGLVGKGALGFTGELVVDLHRLVDSTVARQAVQNNPNTDLVILVSQALHDDVIRPGHLDPNDFTRVEVTTKEFTSPAWLHLSP